MSSRRFSEHWHELMRVTLHIGIEKSGTTALQSALYAKREELAQRGVALLDCFGKPNNQALPAIFSHLGAEDDFYLNRGISGKGAVAAARRETLAEFEDEMGRLAVGTRDVIITSEHFHSRVIDVNDVARLKDLLIPWFDDFRIIAFSRDPVAVLPSLYSTALKVGHRTNRKKFLAEMARRPVYFDFAGLVDRWSRVFGRDAIKIVRFEEARTRPGGIFAAFGEAVALPIALESSSSKNANSSLGPTGEAIFRVINAVFPRYVDGEYRATSKSIGQALRRLAIHLPAPLLYRGKIPFDAAEVERVLGATQ